MVPIIGALIGGGASGLFGGAAGGGFMGALMGGLMNNGGLGGLLNNLLAGGSQSSGNQQTDQLLGDIKSMLGELLDGKGGGCGGVGGRSHDCGGAKPLPYHPAGDGCGGCHDHVHTKEPTCDDPKQHHCDEADGSRWDGKDKSPSLDRERGAARLLEQAKNTHDPEQKRELIGLALDMLGKRPKSDGLFSKVLNERDGNSYDKDVVKQAHKMLDQIDDGCLDHCNESKALDSVIDMLMEDGGVDGQPAAGDSNGNGRRDKGDVFDRRMPYVHHHLHDALFHDH